MRENTRATSHKQAETDRAADDRQPPRQPLLIKQSINPVSDNEQDEGDRLSQLEEPLIPNNDRPLEDNPTDTVSSVPRNHRHKPQNSILIDYQEVQDANPDFRCLQNAMLAIMRRVDDIDKRHTLHFRRFKERQKKRDSAYSSKDWEDNTWNEDQEADNLLHHKSKQETETAQSKRLASSSKGSKREKPTQGNKPTRPPPTEYQRRRYVGQINNNLFSDEIRNARFLEKLNLTEFTKYDGSQDPTTHVEDFEMVMVIRGLEEPIISRIFAATLKGPGLKWLHTLPEKSVHKFQDLAETFEMHFATSKRQSKSQYTLSKSVKIY